ncbi:MAG: branched-chain amino acid ABC transporter permease [Deltaproteobacteria bacterium]|nr:branched-chain amino acid ABC transporter permease [Deltaproteobacteria bacterium]MBM4322885.1 branched-chain amino acid ABC transporter permease [Deltaproteobacteria bacterium]
MGLKNKSNYTRWIVYLILFIALLFIPRILSIHNLMLFEYGLTFAIVGLGFNLLLGYTGLLSFGHGAYFAAGAYTVAMIGKYYPQAYSLEILIPAALFFSLILSLIFGFVCVRHTKIFFSILALSLSMLLFALLFKLYHITGGSDGLRVPLPTMFGFSFKGVRRPEFLSGTYYYFLLVMFAISFFIMKGIVSSPFGKALQAIRDNEVRAELIGIRVRRYRLYAFVISGMFVGLGGALWTFVNGHVTADLSHWVFSGEIVYMTLLGGFGIFEGPIVGAIIFTYLKLYAMGNTQYWMFVIGATLIVLVLLLPNGVAGAFSSLWRRIKKSD